MPRSRVPLRSLATAAALAACVLPLSACYEHVVSAQGYDTEGLEVHEPNLREDWDSAPTEAERRTKRRQDLKNLNRSIPRAPAAY